MFESIYRDGIRHFALGNYYPPSLTGEWGHVTAIGSLADTGDEFDGTWEGLFDELLSELSYEDGGGIVINHPKRTGLSVEGLLGKLDFDERVLGVEAYNHRCEVKYFGTGDALSVCLGRTAADRPDGVQLLQSGLPSAVGAAGVGRRDPGTERPARPRMHRACGRPSLPAWSLLRRVTGFWTRLRVDPGRRGHDRGDETYVRVEARDDRGERIFFQPVVYDFAIPDGTVHGASLTEMRSRSSAPVFCILLLPTTGRPRELRDE